MTDVKKTIRQAFVEELERNDIDPPENIDADTALLDTGLDSLGFATLVIRLEDELGYDPFQIMDKPVYPDTFGEFVRVYERYSDQR